MMDESTQYICFRTLSVPAALAYQYCECSINMSRILVCCLSTTCVCLCIAVYFAVIWSIWYGTEFHRFVRVHISFVLSVLLPQKYQNDLPTMAHVLSSLFIRDEFTAQFVEPVNSSQCHMWRVHFYRAAVCNAVFPTAKMSVRHTRELWQNEST